MTKTSFFALAALFSGITVLAAAYGGTLDEVKQRGTLRCGVSTGVPGLSEKREDGSWRGLDVDFCRAVAVAALDDSSRVEFVPLETAERFDALKNGRIDLLTRNTSWTMERDTELGIDFAGINYFDGQGFLVRAEKGFYTALQLDKASVCVVKGTTSHGNLEQYFQLNRMQLKSIALESREEAVTAFLAGRCDALTTDHSQLNGVVATYPKPSDLQILPETISKEPLGPAVRQDDPIWSDIVRWTLYAMINAEEHGIRADNIDLVRKQARTSKIRYALGLEGHAGQPLGLNDDWVYRVIREIGNYGESFDRNLGKGSRLKIGRGLNALWRDGGLMYAPPLR